MAPAQAFLDAMAVQGRYIDLAKTVDGRRVYVMNDDPVPLPAE